VFIFASRAEAGDVITDFRNLSGDNDRFHISAAGFGGGLVAGRALSASQFQTANDNLLQGKAEASIHFIWEADATRLWYDSNGSGAGGLLLVADLRAGARIGAGDIWLF
jgi:Ca2+-binding RTX toxin-like protein